MFEGKLSAIACDSLMDLPYTVPAVAVVFDQPIKISPALLVRLDVDRLSGETGPNWARQLVVAPQPPSEREFSSPAGIRINAWRGDNKVNCQGRSSKWFVPWDALLGSLQLINNQQQNAAGSEVGFGGCGGWGRVLGTRVTSAVRLRAADGPLPAWEEGVGKMGGVRKPAVTYQPR